MKKILFFIESLANGGAEKALVNLVKQLDKNKYDIHVCTITDEDTYQSDINKICHYRSFLHKKNYKKRGLSKLLFWLGIKYIYNAPISLVYRVFVKEKFDIEVAFLEGFATKFISSSNNSDSKKYAWVHIDTTKNEYADRSYKNMEQQIQAYRQFDKIVFVSDTVKKTFEQKFQIYEKAEVIHNILDLDEIKKGAKEKIDYVPNDHLQMIAIGRLEHQKGFVRLIDALGSIDNKEYALWILGSGTQQWELEDRIKKYHLESNVKLLGFDKNPYKFISKANALVCSSYAEGYSTVISESLILGVPVFSVECSGVAEQLKEGLFGRVVPNTNENLTDMLRELINDPSMIDRYKQNISAVPFGSQAAVLQKVERLFDE